MKASDTFSKIINDHLLSVAAGDPLFAETMKKPAKNIDDCVTYIMNTVKSSGRAGFADEEIFNMAVHYYDEDDIKPGANVSGKVVVNHSIAAPAVTQSKVPKMPAPAVPVAAPAASIKAKPKKQPIENQPSLF